MSKLNMPETVPVLTENHFCKGALSKGKRHCLMGWCEHLSMIKSGIINVEMVEKFQESILKEIKKREPWTQYLEDFNDSHTNRQNAEVFNAGMRRLGYTEIIEE